MKRKQNGPNAVDDTTQEDLIGFISKLKYHDGDVAKLVSNSVVDNIDYFNHPQLSFEKLTSMYNEKTVLCLDDVLDNENNWRVVYQQILDILKYGYQDYETRTMLIHFIIHKNDTKMYRLQIVHFLSNLILWYIYVATDSVDILDDSFIFDFVNKSQNNINDYLNDKAVALIDADSTTISAALDDISFNIVAVSKAFSPIIGQGFSSFNLVKASKKIPEIREILMTKIDTSMQPKEIEQFLSKRTDRLIELLCSFESDFRPLFLSGKNLSKGQFKEVAVSIGFKSDLNGKVITKVIDNNILVGGLSTPSQYYIDAKSGHKAAIFGKIEMSDPGAFSKRATVASADVLLRKDYEECDSEVPIFYNVINKDFLLMLNGRNYYTSDGSLRMINGYKDTHLIGSVIPVKSPATCNSRSGVCCSCYGHLFNLNSSLASAGAFSAIIETEPLGQKVLGTKHEQQTDSVQIAFNEEFDIDFELSGTEICMNDSGNGFNDDNLLLMFDEIFKEYDDDDKPIYFVKGYSVIDVDGAVVYNVSEVNETNLYISPELLSVFPKSVSKTSAVIPFSSIDRESPLFNIDIVSKESTDAVKQLKRLLENENHDGCTDLSSICQRMAEVKLKSSIMHDFVHHEMIIHALIRKKSNVYDYADFGPNGDHEDYDILRLVNAVCDSPSPLTSLRGGYLKRLITSPQLFDGSKTAPSGIDPMFATRLKSII